MKNLIFIKLGGSVITHKDIPFKENISAIKRLAGEIGKTSRKTKSLFIVGHGGGSYPHVPAKKYKTHKGLVGKDGLRGLSEVQDAAARLNRIVIGELIKAGLNAVSLSPSSFIYARNGKPAKSFLEPLKKLLKVGGVPVVYGDVVMDEKMGCSILSTESIFAYLVKRLKKDFEIKRIIYCTDTDGVYDSQGKTIPLITPKNFSEVKKQIKGSKSTDVTGGMIHKVEESIELVKRYKIEVDIVNGTRRKRLLDEVVGGGGKGTKMGILQSLP
jgi:isopentenyl phosphate kinase